MSNSVTKMIDPAERGEKTGQKGSALVIALFVLALISVFVALALSRTSSEAAAVGNESAEARTLYAAQGGLEMMTRNFNKIFETKLNPTQADLDRVRNGAVPGLEPEFTFTRELDRISLPSDGAVVLSGGPYVGLYALRDNWRLRTTATDVNGTQVELTRNILNNRIPIFQFGIFYDDDLDLFRPPRFSFGGRVHSNRHFFVSPGSEGVYFDSRVTAHGHIITQTWRNGYTGDSGNTQTFIKNASGVFKQLLPTKGSVLNGTPNVFGSGQFADPDMPSSKINSSFTSQSAIFDGNLQAQVRALKLPLKVGNDDADLIEMIRRGHMVGDMLDNSNPVTTTNADNLITTSERFANKTGLRISLADSKAKLPGCASGTGATPVTTQCGVRLDGKFDGLGAVPDTLSTVLPERSRGYQPKPMTDGYQGTRLNGERLFTGGSREVWIKVESVQTNDITGEIETKDLTEDILSLGVTQEAPSNISILGPVAYTGSRSDNGSATSPSSNITDTNIRTPSTFPDSRSVIKLQRFAIPGTAITSGSNMISASGSGSSGLNFVKRYTSVSSTDITGWCATGCTAGNAASNSTNEDFGLLLRATINGTTDLGIVPFPIEVFDTREGEYYDDSSKYASNKVTRNGVMSMVDIDVANLRRFLRGDFDRYMPTSTPYAVANGGNSLKSADIPQRNGWVLYISDRRGDADFDGEYDMEDIYGSSGNDGILQLGEDVNHNNVLDANFMNPNSESCVGFEVTCEAAKYSDVWFPDYAAVTDHKYYRRGVRLINGTTIPGLYDSSDATATKGFTVTSENGIYIWGNYNATGVASVPSTGNTPYNDYRPFNTSVHIPASVVGDAITILSNSWNDAKSFDSPYDEGGRLASDTTVRFAMIAGDTIATKNATPNQGGTYARLNGGVHNFKRFLERWTGERLNYSGSLINLYNSRNNNGSFKCCETVYDPPTRNWVFDSTFLDPARLPPGTPFFQYVQTTGFERSTD